MIAKINLITAWVYLSFTPHKNHEITFLVNLTPKLASEKRKPGLI